MRNAEDLDARTERLVTAGEADSLAAAVEDLEKYSVVVCWLVWELEVPTAEFYVVEIGRRGDLTFTHEELVEQDWVVVSTLG